MANYAKVLDGKIIKVIVAEPEFFDTFIDSSPGEWVLASIFDVTPENKNDVNRIRAKLVEIRTQRDQLLADTDWLMVVDSPASDDCKQTYQDYRASLRSLPEHITDVDAVVWPVKPAYIAK